jgi:hypothetical protein
MNTALSTALAVAAASLLGCSSPTVPPQHPTAVPPGAVWSGGPDGGAWVDCKFTTKEPYIGYSCTLYHDSGATWAHGIFALATVGVDHSITPEQSDFAGGDLSDIKGYDGNVIFLSGSHVLVPHVEVTYPDHDGHGVRVKYEFGTQQSETRF